MGKPAYSIKYLLWFLAPAIVLTFLFVMRPESLKISLGEVYDDCTASANTRSETGSCLRELASHLDAGYGIRDVETTIKNLTGSQKLQWCHEFVHYVGWEIFKNKKSLAKSFSVASGTCDSGMYHGIMEEYIRDIGVGYDTEHFLNVVIPHACDDIISSPLVPPAMAGLCYHGLGHAFMLIAENDLNRSLQLCEHLNAGLEEGCYTGSFMENIQSKQVGADTMHPKIFAFNTDDIDYPCNVLDEKYKEFCYLYKGVADVIEEKGDFGKAFANCLKINPKYQSKCFYGIGSNIPGPHWPSTTAAEKCKVALDVSSEAYRQCILGALSFVAQLSLGKPGPLVDFCEIIEPDYKNLCYKTAGTQLSSWVTPKESLEEKCSFFKNTSAQEICNRSDYSY